MKLRITFYVLIVLLILATLYPITSSAQDASVYMYWTDTAWVGSGTPKIQRANLDGSNVQDLVTGVGFPIGIAVDLAGGKMYWTDKSVNVHSDPHATNRILRANLNGTGIETLVITRSTPQSTHSYFNIVLDTAAGKMYWTVSGAANAGRKIQRANLDGTNVEDLVTEVIGPESIALDLPRGKMYWTDRGAGKIQRANLNGTNVEDIVLDLSGPHSLALDLSHNKIYWTDTVVGKIRRANLDGSNIEDIATSTNFPTGITLDLLNGKIYWAGHSNGKIHRANLDGSNAEDIVTGLNHPWGIALGVPQTTGGLRFSPNVIADQTLIVGTYASLTLPEATGGTPPYTYSTSALPTGLSFDPATQQIYGTPTTVVSAYPVTYTVTDATGSTASLDFTITVQGTPPLTDLYMYWTDHGTDKIQRANLDGTNIQDLIAVNIANRIALDVTGEKIYWPNGTAMTIQRANLDGTNIEDLVITGASIPNSIELDLAAGKVYWSSYNTGTGKIQSANLDGTNIQDLITTLSRPADLALDVPSRKMYWTDYNTNKIQRANLDGSDIEDLLTTGLSGPDGIALDLIGRKMYWTDYRINQGTAKIRRANLDGSDIEDLLTTGLSGPDGIALDLIGRKMYWTDHGTDKIQRANLDGTNVEDLITTGLSAPVDIALGIPQPSSGLRFSPNVIADQTFTVGTAVSLTLPTATGGTVPYTYTLTPQPPIGLQFDAATLILSGTPNTPIPTSTYTYTAIDAIGASATLTFTITVTGAGGLDVNADGQVNVLDLMLVVVFYGRRGDGLPADVNADGIVNIPDLVAVAEGVDAAGGLPLEAVEAALLAVAAEAKDIEAIAGAPAGLNRHQHTLFVSVAHRNVAAALADVSLLSASDPRLGRGIALLSELLHLLKEMLAIPETTALLPNYPNPFNPETWIPYHLAEDTDVTLTIYNVQGRVVRELRLGHQPAGVYESQGRAAYWDGRNQIGEPVASGLYFYTITAGEFTATRKLLIAK